MEESKEARLQKKLEELPTAPGIYLYKNDRGRVIYVGKAKNLRNRVRSYFQDSRSFDPKTESLVGEIADIDLIKTSNELEAIILENSLIKTEKPKYNVMLRDDKDWLYIKLSIDEPFARAMLIRRPDKHSGLVFGPYIPAWMARRTKALLHKYFGIRTCNREITGNDPRACLQYDMGRCCGPCIKKSVWGEYAADVERARKLLEGKNDELLKELKEAMMHASRRQQYERAAGYRDAIEIVAKQSEEQRIASTGFEEQDIFASHIKNAKAVMIMFAVRNGLVRSKKEFFWDHITPGEAEQLLSTTIQQFYHGISYIPNLILVQRDFEGRELLEQWLTGQRGSNVEIRHPQRGKKRNLLKLAEENAELSWKNRFTIIEKDALKKLQEVLELPTLPRHIECFDISTIQGSDQVASMVYWQDGKPRKSEYRKYKIKTVEGSDDFASMREAVLRRYTRQVREEKELPDLVLIDGGKGQLGSAVKAMDEAGVAHVPVASLAKKDELLFLPGRKDPVYLKRSDPALRLVQRIRDEAHRFAVTFHRSRRTKRTLTTELKRIPGIGPKLARKLLTSFGSLEQVKRADQERIAEIIGPVKAEMVWHYLHEGNMDEQGTP